MVDEKPLRGQLNRSVLFLLTAALLSVSATAVAKTRGVVIGSYLNLEFAEDSRGLVADGFGAENELFRDGVVG